MVDASHTCKNKSRAREGLCVEEVIQRGQSMGTIHCQDALDSPHTNSRERFHSLIELKPLQSDTLQREKCQPFFFF